MTTRPAVIVLAGGRSTRMGTDKAWLEIDGEPMLARVCAALAPAAERILVAGGAAGHDLPELPAGAVTVADDVPGAGPLAGLAAAVRAVDPSTELVFVCPCDVPGASADLVRWMAATIGDAGGLVPRVGGREQPLVALYRRSVLAQAGRLVASGRRDARALIEIDGVRIVESDALADAGFPDSTFHNVNRPDDLP